MEAISNGVNQTALITGGSSGIGLELAKVFAKNGYELILVARSEQELNAAAADLQTRHEIKINTFAADLSAISGPQAVYNFCKQQNLQVHVLVNNAGFGVYGPFLNQNLQKQLNMLDLNIRALTELTGLFAAPMVERKSGKILNVASTAAFQPGPFFATYYASKAYVLSLSKALRSELNGYGISVTCLCPGPTKTAFFNKDPAMKNTRLIGKGNLMQPGLVAEYAYNALMKNQAVVIPGFYNKFLAFGAKILPANLVTAISRWTLEKYNP